MNKSFFWNNWNKPFRYTYIFLLVLLGLNIIYFAFAWFTGGKYVIFWDTYPAQELFPAKIDSFISHLLKIQVDTENYLIKESFFGSEIQVRPIFSYIFLITVVIAVIAGITIITYLDLSWYAISMLGFILFITNIRTETLYAFNNHKPVLLLVALLTYLPASYYFQAFNKSIPLNIRLTVFTTITIVLCFLIHFCSAVQNPFLYLANYNIAFPMALTVLMLIIIGYEFINGFLFLTTASKNISSQSGLRNFVIISFLYIGNLLLLLLKKMNTIDWDILYLDAHWLMVFSIIIGIWGVKSRRENYDAYFPFYPVSGILYLCMSIIALSITSYAFLTANDPLKESIEYAIIYTHLIISFGYLVYVIVNFFHLFNKHRIFEIVNRPILVPFFMFRGVTIVAVIALFLYANKFPYYLGLAGYFNSVGDIYNYENDLLTAKEYYKKGVQYEYQNHRSNYSVASISEKNKNFNEAIEYYTRANRKRPMEHAFVNLSRIYLGEDMYFPAMFMLKDGLKHFPESPILHNNLGLLYLQKNISDSAYHHLNLAEIHSGSEKRIAILNTIAFLLNKGLSNEADSIAKEYKFDYPGFLTNKIASENFNGNIFEGTFDRSLIADSSLSLQEFSLFYNYCLNKIKTGDTFIPDAINALINHPSHAEDVPNLQYLLALYKYYNNQQAEARKTMDVLIGSDESSIPPARTAGLWMFEQGLYKLSEEYLGRIRKNLSEDLLLSYTIALMHQNKDISFPLFQLSNSADPSIQKILSNLRLINTTNNIQEIKNSEESVKYQFLKIKIAFLSDSQIEELYNSLLNGEIKILASADLAEYYLNRDDLKQAEKYLNALGIIKDEETYIHSKLNLQNLFLLCKQTNFNELRKLIKDIYLNDKDIKTLPYFYARLAQEDKNIEEAENQYQTAIRQAPFNDIIRTDAALFYHNINQDEKAYNILFEGLELNPYSVQTLKAYILQSLRINLLSYANAALQDLKSLISEKEYNEFWKEYEKEKIKSENNL
ncbi:MAG: hypothetical protein ACK40G_06195 [Cytophagaceae bacterium]